MAIRGGCIGVRFYRRVLGTTDEKTSTADSEYKIKIFAYSHGSSPETAGSLHKEILVNKTYSPLFTI
jgi:hypothetical protein